MTRKLNLYYLVNFLYNFARVLPHSILTVLLMNKGISLAEISLIQSFYMLTALISEFPSGVLTEIIGEKKMYQISLILLGISYLGVYVFDDVFLLSIIWGIYGLSSAAMFGAFLYKHIGINLYLISIVILILALFILSFFIKIEANRTSSGKHISIKYQIRNIVRETISLKSELKLMYLILLSCSFQIVVQLYFQYWQVFFQQKEIKVAYFGIIYALFQIIAILSTYVFSKFTLNKTPFRLIIMLISIVSLSLLFSLFSTNILIFAILFSIFLLTFNLYDNVLEYLIMRNVKSQFMSSFISLFGTLSSIVSTIILWVMSILLSFQSLERVSFYLIVVFLLLSLILCYKYYTVKSK